MSKDKQLDWRFETSDIIYANYTKYAKRRSFEQYWAGKEKTLKKKEKNAYAKIFDPKFQYKFSDFALYHNYLPTFQNDVDTVKRQYFNKNRFKKFRFATLLEGVNSSF